MHQFASILERRKQLSLDTESTPSAHTQMPKSNLAVSWSKSQLTGKIDNIQLLMLIFNYIHEKWILKIH